MGSRIMQVFYGANDFLPYKDKERTIHYPIVGNSFNGASNVNEIRFYVGQIGGVNNVTWVCVVKLPNGKILYEILANPQLDSELNEYYLPFSLSSFYTQIKGDLYISLNGCNGEIDITTDDETDISTIEGTIASTTIVTTGAVKLSIYYAPQRPIGFSFELDQYQEFVNALSNKANIFNTIQIINDLANADLSSYSVGQLFYDLTTKTYYRYTGLGVFTLAENGLLGSDHTILRFVYQAGDSVLNFAINLGLNRLFIYRYNNVDYLMQITSGTNADTYKVSAYNIVTQELWTRDNWGLLNTFPTDLLSDTYKFKYVKQSNGLFLLYGTDVEGNQTTLEYSQNTIGFSIVQRDINGQIDVPLSPTQNAHSTSKKYVDDLINGIKANQFILVDTSVYPTLNAFKATTGEEGYIYLYPINTSDLTKGYYQYIWEGNAWLDIGTTQIDLSNYYTKGESDALLNQKANDNVVVKLSENQLISGTKQFVSSPIVPDPTNAGHSANKYYVDTQDALKVDKTNNHYVVYATDGSGNQTTFEYDTFVNGQFVRRVDSNSGNIYVGNPTAMNHATPKSYVDNAISNAISNVYKIKGSKTVAEINALTGMQAGDVYNLLDSGTITLGSLQVFTGDNIVWTGSAWDKLGAEIDWTAYDEKFIAAGFFEVQPYNESTGEITFVYSTELYIMSYDSDTGIMTIQAN